MTAMYAYLALSTIPDKTDRDGHLKTIWAHNPAGTARNNQGRGCQFTDGESRHISIMSIIQMMDLISNFW